MWPQEDEKQVKLMMAMIHHCTGMPLTALRQDLWPRTESEEAKACCSMESDFQQYSVYPSAHQHTFSQEETALQSILLLQVCA